MYILEKLNFFFVFMEIRLVLFYSIWNLQGLFTADGVFSLHLYCLIN